ncbi:MULTISPECIES: YbaK/EbsC family protein [Enterococcus]|uniref:YbaK/EbsC family protein n=1 Tax=Enterococcus sp. AZ103 TaxID=2774628 RepID=UPI003F26526B
MGKEQEVYDLLDSNGITYDVIEHQAVFTVDEIDFDIPDGTEVKNLLLKAKKKENYYFVICPGEKRVNLKALTKKLDEKNLSFASADRLLELLDLTPGSVSPLALYKDKEHKIKLVIDESIDRNKNIGFHPNVNTATIVINFQEFLKYLKVIGVEPHYVEVPSPE